MTVVDVPASTTGAILFTDLVGFTEFNGVVGDARALEVLEAQTAILGRVLAECPGGRLVKELGDGLMVWFATAADALQCSVDLMSAVESARATDGFPLALRLGLHHGPALERGDDLVGQAVNIAARVCELAGPGELLVSEELIARLDRVPDVVSPVGAAWVKGVAEPIWLHRVAL